MAKRNRESEREIEWNREREREICVAWNVNCAQPTAHSSNKGMRSAHKLCAIRNFSLEIEFPWKEQKKREKKALPLMQYDVEIFYFFFSLDPFSMGWHINRFAEYSFPSASIFFILERNCFAFLVEIIYFYNLKLSWFGPFLLDTYKIEIDVNCIISMTDNIEWQLWVQFYLSHSPSPSEKELMNF